jgi:beta-fructofuranosidase
MKGNYNIFYTPEKQYPGMPHGEMCGDFMPFFWKGTYYLFYLYKCCVYAVETTDFVHYGQPYLVLQNGSPDDQDWHIGTGSVFENDGTFYFHYTGFCEGNKGVEGKNEQVVMRATSTDLKTWEKDKTFFFKPDTRYYGNLHWRDPHVIWNIELQKFFMIITATEKDGAYLRNGCTAVYTSKDVRNWEHYKTLYAPRTFITHECHDCFKMGNKWYLTFSNYSRWWETRYRIADNFDGPWKVPVKDDMFDGREFYAAKSVKGEDKRYMVGWESVRQDCKDSGRHIWGGNILVHELVQREDGSLGVKIPERIEQSFATSLPLAVTTRQGSFSGNKDELLGEAADGFGWGELGELKETCLFTTTISWSEGTEAVGLMIHADSDLKKWCQLRLEVNHNKIVMDRYNRVDGDQSYLDERPVTFDGNSAEIKLIVSGNIMLVYVNDVALTSRCYEIETGSIGIFVEYGKVNCRNTNLLEQVRTIK